MTEWDHGHEGHDGPDGHDTGPDLPDLPEHDLGWEASGPDAQLSDPAHPGDPYGSPDHPEPAAGTEPAGFPEEQPADWSGAGGDVPHAEPGAWDHDPDPGVAIDGTDPAGWADSAGADPFPPALDVDVQPGDGGPWVDPDLLGTPEHWAAAGPDPEPPAALLPDLAAADGDPDAGWDTLRDSDDPAVRALAQHWNP